MGLGDYKYQEASGRHWLIFLSKQQKLLLHTPPLKTACYEVMKLLNLGVSHTDTTFWVWMRGM